MSAASSSVSTEPDWSLAVCWERVRQGTADPNWWFPDGEYAKNSREYVRAKKRAVAACQLCPIKQECGEFAKNIEFGIWGGLSAAARHRLKRKVAT